MVGPTTSLLLVAWYLDLNILLVQGDKDVMVCRHQYIRILSERKPDAPKAEFLQHKSYKIASDRNFAC